MQTIEISGTCHRVKERFCNMKMIVITNTITAQGATPKNQKKKNGKILGKVKTLRSQHYSNWTECLENSWRIKETWCYSDSNGNLK